MNNRTHLTKDVSENKIATHLSNIELRNSTLVSREFHRLFKIPLLTRGATELMSHVINANWCAIESFVHASPMLMFHSVEFIDIDHQKKRMSPLEYLFYVHDHYGQIVIETKARQHGLLSKYLTEARSQKKCF